MDNPGGPDEPMGWDTYGPRGICSHGVILAWSRDAWRDQRRVHSWASGAAFTAPNAVNLLAPDRDPPDLRARARGPGDRRRGPDARRARRTLR